MTKIASFISFKGGSGRSVALTNVAYQLARSGKRVGCVDFDIEAGGLHRILGADDTSCDSIQHWLMGRQDHSAYLRGAPAPDYDDPEEFKRRLVIPASERTDQDWSAELPPGGAIYLIQAQPDAQATGMVDTGMNLFYQFNKLLKTFGSLLQLDYVLVDCRSGISNLALPGLAYCNAAMVFLRWTPQHRYGTDRLLNWYSRWLTDSDRQMPIVVTACAAYETDIDGPGLARYCEDVIRLTPRATHVIPFIEKLRLNDHILWRAEDAEAAGPYGQLTTIMKEVLDEA